MSASERFEELSFFLVDNVFDGLDVLFDFRKCVAEQRHGRVHQIGESARFGTEFLGSIADAASEDSAEDVTWKREEGEEWENLFAFQSIRNFNFYLVHLC